MITNYGKSGLTLMMAGSSNQPMWCAIGSGSGAEVATLGSLVAEVIGSRTLYTDRDITVANNVAWQFDFSSVVMSGINLTEFGIAGSQAKDSQTLWNRDAFPAINFDGSNELQVNINFKVY